MSRRWDESASAAEVADPVRAAEELVSAAWLTHLAQAEQYWVAGARACRHMRLTAEESLRSAMVSGDPRGIVAAQTDLETARADEAACESRLEGFQELLDRELAVRGFVPGAVGDREPPPAIE